MNPTNAEWWWRYGLDGVIGALIGGVVAGLVAARILKSTVVHERKLAREVAVMELAARVRGHALRVLVPMAAGRPTGAELLPQVTDLQASAFELTGLAARDWPAFSARISELMPPISQAIADDRVLGTRGLIASYIWKTVEAVAAACDEFLRDPEGV